MGSPRLTQCAAGALVLGGKALLVKRSPQRRFYPGAWDLFGGHIEGSETAEEALRREAREELHVEVESCHRLGKVHDPLEHGNDNSIWPLTFFKRAQ